MDAKQNPDDLEEMAVALAEAEADLDRLEDLDLADTPELAHRIAERLTRALDSTEEIGN